MNNNYRTKKIAAICFSLIALILVIIAVLPSKKAPDVSFDKLHLIPGNAEQTTTEMTQKNYYFSNGMGIIKYDVTSGVSENITNTLEISRIEAIKVSPDEKHVAFATDNSIATMEPFKSIIPVDADQNTQMWWIVDTVSKKISFAATDTQYLYWLNNSEYVYGLGSGVYKDSVNSSESVNLYAGNNVVRVLGVVDGEIYFDERDKQIGVLNKQNQVRKLSDASTAATLSNKAGCFLHRKTLDEREETTIKLIGCGKKDRNIQEELLSATFSDDGRYLFYYYFGEGGEVVGKYIDNDSGDVGDWDIDIDNTSEDIEIIKVTDFNNALIRIGNQFYNQKIKQPKLIDNNNSYTVGGIIVDINKDSQLIVTSKDSEYTSQDKQNVLDSLDAKGIDSNLINIKFTIISTNDDRWS